MCSFPSRSRTLFAVAAFMAVLASTEARAEERIDTDRPDFADSPEVVGDGRFQVETGFVVERNKEAGLRERLYSTPTLLRYGIGERFEVRLETEGLQRYRAEQDGSGTRENGFADTALGMKWHIADRDEDEGKPALALLAEAEFDSGSAAFRGKGVRPGVWGIAEWEFDGGWSTSMMAGVTADRDEDGSRFASGLVAITLGKALDDRWSVFGELATPEIAARRHGGTTAAFDAGFTYLVNDALQLDFSFVRGLNSRMPDWQWGVGLSFRL